MDIIKKDSWNAGLYDTKHSFVSAFGEELIGWLNPLAGERILDLGCGTGDLAEKLDKAGVSVMGIDNSSNMVEQAYRKYPHIQFDVQDATNLSFKDEFDAVFSNAMLHWVKQPQKALQSIFQALKPGGRFVAEFGGKGNVKLITDEVIRQLNRLESDYNPHQFPWFFPSIGEYTSLMEEAGFRVILAQHFDRPTPLQGKDGLRNWIEMFASSMLGGLSEETIEEILLNSEEGLKNQLFQDGVWMADYKRIRVLGIKE
ncbi:class I SAM-dependent methyltransferase [Mesobacillus foraminis]|uniref:Ubiquinone/menaquinone biosynthesis C-methylase UbiE n=1 Tax=Mesobacillus foraminis TaxID=279826 RepID=A0A4R2BA01_9BACI|nr:class I SAM-dependent methyltransferase [Mesobacillus foraminis]TCN22379.1 ubiquinone/menaquinone biosynthesis C-methylase UbiE [Mesobacillus foraminis]